MKEKAFGIQLVQSMRVWYFLYAHNYVLLWIVFLPFLHNLPCILYTQMWVHQEAKKGTGHL